MPGFEVIRDKFFEFRLLRRTTVDPEVRREIRLFIILSRRNLMQQCFSHGIYSSAKRVLHLSPMLQTIPGCPYVDRRHKEQRNDSNRYSQWKARLLTAKYNITNVVLEMHNQHQRSVYDNKERK